MENSDINSFPSVYTLEIDTFRKYCRLCLSESDSLLSIFGNKDNSNIQLELSTCLSIEITAGDVLPKSICVKCVDKLHEFYTFYINAKYCEQWLLDCLPSETMENVDKTFIEQASLKSPYENEIFTEFLDSSNNSFDMGLLTNDTNTFSALEYLTGENHTQHTDVANKLVNSGIKVTKVTNMKNIDGDTNPPNGSYEIHMEIDVLDSDLDIVNELLSKQSRSTPLLIENVETEEAVDESYSCMSCKSIFNDFEKLANHMGSCEALKRTCVDCGILFESKDKMLKHAIVHTSAQPYNCKHCGKHFIGIDRLNQHIEKCHSDFVSSIRCVYKCRECGDIFQSRDKLYVHAKSHVKLKIKTNAETYVCEDCGNRYSSKSNLHNHRKLKHPNDVKNETSCVYRCKVCSKIFLCRNQLYLHIKQHTNVLENTQHLCDTCGKSFNTYNSLSRHVLSHVGNKFECSICKRQFINGSLLKKHLSSHEIETQVCEVCGLIFSNDVLLNIHRDEHVSNLM